MNPPDPWESIPADKRLDFGVIREPLDALTAATIMNVERALPPEILKVPGTLALFLLLAKIAETMFNTIRYFCADKPEDSARRVWFASSSPPLLRSMLDEICTLIFLGEDMPGRVQWYYKAGWRELREEYDRHVERYAGKPGWDPWLEEFRESLKTVQVQAGITAAEIADPASVRWWPTLSKMIRAKMLGAEAQAFLQYMSDWFYREFSQEDHLSLPGLIRRGSAFLRRPDNPLTEAILRKPDDPAMENTWKKLRSDWVTDALVLYLAFLTEIILLCGFDLRSRCAYLWGVIKEYSPMAAEVYEVRYETKLKS